MPFDISVPKNGVAAKKADERSFKSLVNARVGALPDDFSSVTDGLLPALGASGVQVPSVDYTAGNRAIYAMKPKAVRLTGATTCNQTDHLGCVLYNDGATALTVTINPGTTAASQIDDGFACTFARLKNCGRINFSLGAGLTNQDTSGRLAVAEGGLVQIWRIGSALFIVGSLES